MDCWVLTDGAAGNLRQAQALAVALGHEAQTLTLHGRLPWRWFAPRRLPAATRAFGPEFSERLATPPATPVVAIGCGRQAALATRLLRACHGGRVRTVQILDPRIATDAWDVVVAPAHDRLQGRNLVQCIGSLHPVDERWLAEARLRFARLARLPSPRTVLLLGGPTARVPMTLRWFETLASTLEHWLQRDGGSLLVSSSRRTPQWLQAAVRHRFGDAPGLQWHGPQDGENPYPGLLACADRIVVTPDSSNLLSEAAATGVPVLVHVPRPLSGKPGRLYRALLEGGQVRPLRDRFSPWQPVPLRELPRVAAAVRALLPA